MLASMLILSCGICVAAGIYVGVTLVREFPRLRNKVRDTPPEGS
jgi:hypothetical protein